MAEPPVNNGGPNGGAPFGQDDGRQHGLQPTSTGPGRHPVFGGPGAGGPGFAAPSSPPAPPAGPSGPSGPSRRSFPWLPLGIGAVVALVVVLVLNLTGSPVFSDPAPTPGPPTGQPTEEPAGGACEDPAAPSDSGSPAPEPTPEPAPPTTYPKLDAGAVAPKKPATLSGFGNTEVSYARAGDILTAYQFDCPDCQKKMRLYDRAQDQQLISFETAPFSDSWLLDRPVRAQPLTNSVVIEADGHWTMTLRHAADLPVAKDVEAGQGQAMANVPNGQPRELDFAPYDEDDALNYYVVDLRDGSNSRLGCTEGGTVSIDNKGGPYVLLISTYGDWTLRRR